MSSYNIYNNNNNDSNNNDNHHHNNNNDIHIHENTYIIQTSTIAHRCPVVAAASRPCPHAQKLGIVVKPRGR